MNLGSPNNAWTGLLWQNGAEFNRHPLNSFSAAPRYRPQSPAIIGSNLGH
jgi:hypothetical protein